MTGTTSLQGGYPYTVVDCSHSPTGNGGSCVLVNAASVGKSCDRSAWRSLAGCIDPNAFVDPCNVNANNRLNCGAGPWEGNVGRNSFRGPGYADVDASLGKYFHIPWVTGHEGAKLQVRGEFFNLFNRVNLNGISSDVSLVANQTPFLHDVAHGTDPSSRYFNKTTASTNDSFGLATGAFFPRTIEVAVRIEF